MPKKLESCVRKVSKTVKPRKGRSKKSSAYAICSKSTGYKRKKGGGWTKKK